MGLMLWRVCLVGLIITTNALRWMRFSHKYLSTAQVERSLISRLHFKVAQIDEAVATTVDDDVEFQDLGESSAGVMWKLSKGLVPLAASIGFAATPSPLIATRLAGAAAGGFTAFIAKALLASLSRSNENEDSVDGESGGGVSIPSSTSVMTAVETLIAGPPISALDLKSIERTARDNRVSSAELGELFTSLFAEVIFGAVTNESDDLTELSEVTDFANAVKLTEAEIGDGFALTASKLSDLLEKDDRGFFGSAPLEVMLYTAKVFFLADKMIGSQEGFYGKRFAVALSFFTPDRLRDIVSDASTKLFQKCVQSVLADPSKFSSDEVEGLRSFLACGPTVSTLRPASMQNMIMEFLQASLDRQLFPEGGNALTAKITDYDNMQRAQEVLGWNPREFSDTMDTRTLPVFEEAAKALIDEAIEFPERAVDLAKSLSDRVQALNIDVRKARVSLTSLISQRNSEYMFKIEKVYNASGGSVQPVFKIMSAYAESHGALKTLSEAIMDGVDIPVPGLPFAEMVRVSLFELQQKQKDPAVMSNMFSLNEEQQRIIKRNMALPKVTSWIGQCIAEGSFNDDAKAAYRKMFADNGVSDSEWRATSVDFYYQEVKRIASTRAVPSEADMIRLASLKSFLDCPDESAAKVNLELLGDKYAKALFEAMTPSGVITEEYESGLDRLRVRLGLTKADAESLLSLVTRKDKLAPLVKDLASQWKSDTDANQREKNRRDKSGDPISSQDNVLGFMETGAQKTGGGPNVFMREALNFIDLATENYRGQGVDLLSMDKAPVSAVGVLPEADLVGIYKHYLITELSEQDPELRSRYYQSERMFGLILGISEEGQKKVKESLAYTAYKNMLKNAMRYSDSIGTDELKQYALLKEALGLDQETADRIYNECAKGAVIETAAAIMRAKESDMTAETARRLRSQVQSLGLDMQKDTGFNERLVAYLYSLEVQFLVDNDMSEDLREVQEAYDIPEERASAIIESCCKRYVSQILNLALRAAKKYDEREAVRIGQQILKYTPFISEKVDADANIFSENDKTRLLSFLSDEVRDHVSEEFTSSLARLKDIINLTEDYVPPLKGMDGLEGKIEKPPQIDDDKKKWSWG